MNENEWECPACNINTNTQGYVFSGCRAVSLHVAGKIRGGSVPHKSWAHRYIGDMTNDSYVRSSINSLADVLELHVYNENQERLVAEQKRRQELLNTTVIEEAPEDIAYRHCRLIETNLHRCVLDTLKENYGLEEEDWWVKGVPSHTRAECAQRRELSPARGELFSYVYLLDLKKIIDKNWGIFQTRYSRTKTNVDSKNKFLNNIEKLNDIRNRVAHPTHESIYGEDIEFVKHLWGLVISFTQGE